MKLDKQPLKGDWVLEYIARWVWALSLIGLAIYAGNTAYTMNALSEDLPPKVCTPCEPCDCSCFDQLPTSGMTMSLTPEDIVNILEIKDNRRRVR